MQTLRSATHFNDEHYSLLHATYMQLIIICKQLMFIGTAEFKGNCSPSQRVILSEMAVL